MRTILAGSLLATLLLSACQPITREAPEQFALDHTQEHVIHWSYEGEGGPGHWSELSADYTACADGSAQSPIDLTGAAGENLPDIVFSYAESPLKILNNGHTIQVSYNEGSYITVDGAQYNLLQFHVHAASEHTIDGQHYPLEFHFVHRNAEGSYAVVGVFVTEGEENPAFADIVANAPAEEVEEMVIDGVTVAAESLLPEERMYFAYSGSLTTPPCSESVKWHVLTTPIEMSAEQIEAIASIVHNNFRPIQSLNDRVLMVDTAHD